MSESARGPKRRTSMRRQTFSHVTMSMFANCSGTLINFMLAVLLIGQATILCQAFLFHQLKPITSSSPQSPSAQPLVSSHYHQQSMRTTTSSLENVPINYQQQQQTRTQAISDLDPTKTTSSDFEPQIQHQQPHQCPRECVCNKTAQIADCSHRNLTQVPASFPADIKRIRLDWNNITELGPMAFKNLKRLQRIDLSNNNLQRIDAMAFSGGLRSLHSLLLYRNKLSQLPVTLFNELSHLQILLLNSNALQCINKGLFAPLTNLNLLSLFDNNIQTLANGTFDGFKNIKTIHLGNNPLRCDCNLRWLADYLEGGVPIETSEARCDGPAGNQGKKLSQLEKQKFKCEGSERASASQCDAPSEPQAANSAPLNKDSIGAANNNNVAPATTKPTVSSNCPAGCTCQASIVDCSRVSSQTIAESRVNIPESIYELPEMPDDVPVYVTRVKMNDPKIKRIRQTSLFKQLANSQKIDLGNNKIVDIEDNAIASSQPNSHNANNQLKPERIVFVLMEKESSCEANNGPNVTLAAGGLAQDACSLAPRVNPPNFDSPCYNDGSCILKSRSASQLSSLAPTANYSCLCPAGFAGPLCEINIDDCSEHQCQNEAICVDGVNSYRCQCRDPSTSGDFCEQLTYATSSANSIAPIALPMVASASNQINQNQQHQPNQLDEQFKQYDSFMAANQRMQKSSLSQIQSRSADLINEQQQQASVSTTNNNNPNLDYLQRNSADKLQNQLLISTNDNENGSNLCRRVTARKFLEDENGCQSVKSLKISECYGSCSGKQAFLDEISSSGASCCQPTRLKRRKVRMQCSDNASYVKIVDIIKKCSCSSKCNATNNNQFMTASSSLQHNQTLFEPKESPSSASSSQSETDQFGSSHQIDTIDAIEI